MKKFIGLLVVVLALCLFLTGCERPPRQLADERFNGVFVYREGGLAFWEFQFDGTNRGRSSINSDHNSLHNTLHMEIELELGTAALLRNNQFRYRTRPIPYDGRGWTVWRGWQEFRFSQDDQEFHKRDAGEIGRPNINQWMIFVREE